MKRTLAALVVMLFLCGCNSSSNGSQRGMEVRQKLLDASGCSFTSVVNADFGNTEYSFKLDCAVDKDGTLSFTVVEPDSIAQIKGSVDKKSGSLRFDDTVLAFPHLAEGEISPVCAPWLFYKALSGGYVRACGKEENNWRVSIDDSFMGENLGVEIWLDSGNKPKYAEIIWQGRKLLSLEISDFTYL